MHMTKALDQFCVVVEELALLIVKDRELGAAVLFAKLTDLFIQQQDKTELFGRQRDEAIHTLLELKAELKKRPTVTEAREMLEEIGVVHFKHDTQYETYQSAAEAVRNRVRVPVSDRLAAAAVLKEHGYGE